MRAGGEGSVGGLIFRASVAGTARLLEGPLGPGTLWHLANPGSCPSLGSGSSSYEEKRRSRE